MDGNSEQDEPAAKPKLRPANENPWYLLATIYGEQPEGNDIDWELHARNRRAWNRHVVGMLNEDGRELLRRQTTASNKPFFLAEELLPFGEEELNKIKREYRRRAIYDIGLPLGEINFKKTEFKRRFLASNLLFPSWTEFDEALFLELSHFSKAFFLGPADFKRVFFTAWTDFSQAHFENEADFEHATFSGGVDLVRSAFAGQANFRFATFSGDTNFKHAIFRHEVQFTNAKFQGPTSFAHAKFEKHPPHIHHAALREDTQWHGVDWPKIPSDPEEAQQHLYNYERLKQEMERLKKQEDEQIFFTRELQCREVVDGFPKNLVSKAYGFVSFYGRSILRPLCGLGFAWLAGLLLLWPLGRTGFRGLKFTEAFGLSFYNLFPFLPYRKEIYTQGFLDELSRLAHFVSAGQAFAGAALLFLFGLALRNRFRMK